MSQLVSSSIDSVKEKEREREREREKREMGGHRHKRNGKKHNTN